MIGTRDQQRRANEAVAATLGMYALTTPRDDPGARFGYECALTAIIAEDCRRAANPTTDLATSFRRLSEAVKRMQLENAAPGARA